MSEWDSPFLFYTLINVAFVGIGHLFGSLIKTNKHGLNVRFKTFNSAPDSHCKCITNFLFYFSFEKLRDKAK